MRSTRRTGPVAAITAVLCAAVLALGAPGALAAPTFSDVPTTHPFFKEIEWMAAEGISTGYSDGTFKPTAPVTRQAMASFLYSYAGKPAMMPELPYFADVPSNHQFFTAIQWMASTGLATGSPNPEGGKPLFKPTAAVSRQAMAAFLWRNGDERRSTLLGPFFADVGTGHAFYAPVQWMAQSGLSTGSTNPAGGKPLYKPTDPVSRQAMSAFLYRYDRLAITQRLSIASRLAQSDGDSVDPAMTPDGSFVAFTSQSTTFLTGEDPAVNKVFLRNVAARSTALVSVSTSGGWPNGPASNPSISANGRFVAFESTASDLVDNDSNGDSDVFVRDRLTNTTVRASVTSAELQAEGASTSPAISGDGRYVAFVSTAPLVGNDPDHPYVYVRDLLDGTTTMASLTSTGAQPAIGATDPSISYDGRYVAFESSSSDVVPSPPGQLQVYLRDRVGNTTTLVSKPATGAPNGAAENASISADGRYIAFQSSSTNLDPAVTDGNGALDVFVRDRVAGTTTHVSRPAGAAASILGTSIFPSISSNGRHVAFSSAAPLVPADSNSRIDAYVTSWQSGTVLRASVTTGGGQATGPNLATFSTSSVSTDGRFVAYSSFLDDLVTDDTNTKLDVFLWDRLAPAG